MNTFVILAAGRGERVSRVGYSLHKALVPLDQRAILSHQIERVWGAPKIVVCVGHNAEQLEDYVRLAHPGLVVTFVYVDGWDGPQGGPGHSLRAARDEVRGSLTFTSCDTLWAPAVDSGGEHSWVAVAPVPTGTKPERWCRVYETKDGASVGFTDKREGPGDLAYTGLAHVAQNHLPVFWKALAQGGTEVEGETQVTPGLEAVAAKHVMKARRVVWTDVGDAEAYRRAVADVSGYDWTKTSEATFIEDGRVVKYFEDQDVLHERVQRQQDLDGAVPTLIDTTPNMMSYEYVDGMTMYAYIDRSVFGVSKRAVLDLLEWAEFELWRDRSKGCEVDVAAAHEFYVEKTMQRVRCLEPSLRRIAQDAVEAVDVRSLCEHVVPVRFHGDFNFGNIIVPFAPTRRFVGIDWRGDFGGRIDYGDMRYDVGKLLAGCVVHWDNARRGDFRRWPLGDDLAKLIRQWAQDRGLEDVDVIGALSLLNSAPLHASPLDEILVMRGVHWLEEATS